jgi:sulfur carrier protein ThiS
MTYKVQIDDEVRDATAEEAAIIEARAAEEIALINAKEAEEAARAATKAALLERLGITAEEAALLLG